MMVNFSRLLELLDAGRVRRLHATPVLREQTVAEHVYGAQCIAMELITVNRAKLSHESQAEILVALLKHDAPEVWTGDIPAHMKKRHPEIAEAIRQEEKEWEDRVCLPPAEPEGMELAIVHAADRLDLAFHLLHERVMGCRHYRQEEIFNRVLEYIEEECKDVEGVGVMVDWLRGQWEVQE